MAKKSRPNKSPIVGRAERVRLSREESLKRMREFPQRKEAFIAAIRKLRRT
jgi:hypothetical protein